MQRGLVVETRDIFRRPLTALEIQALAERRPVRDLFSWRGTRARQLGLVEGALSDRGLVELMAGDPRLLRRPIAVVGSQVIPGFDPVGLAAALDQS